MEEQGWSSGGRAEGELADVMDTRVGLQWHHQKISKPNAVGDVDQFASIC